MGILYNGKIDIKDMLWKPILVGDSIASAIKGIGVKKDSRRFLPMHDYKKEFAYPRPQFERDSYFSLDGEWDFSFFDEEEIPIRFPHKINVPFPPQAKRSGIKKKVKDSFWYQKRFTLPEGFMKDRLILHFGAVDQVARVFMNGCFIGEHEGGYLPFSFDITDNIIPGGENLLQVYCIDDLDPRYPYGKQAKNPGGMWYMQISGIWQSVWLESLYEEHVKAVKCTYIEQEGEVEIEVCGTASEYEIEIQRPIVGGTRKSMLPEGTEVINSAKVADGAETINSAKVSDGAEIINSAKVSDVVETIKVADSLENILISQKLTNGVNRVKIDEIVHWSPEHPALYYFTIRGGEDKVKSYFALRTISIETIKGKKRICLNHKPYFFHGVLDQGYFSDGIYTPVSYKYYENDIRIMKELGFNTLRKHIKIEPARFYYDCDRLGMVVFQDMVNNGDYSYLRDTIWPTVYPFYIGHRKDDRHIKVPHHIRKFFMNHSEATVDYLYNFPSVLYYTIFNEGWGQFDSERVLAKIRKHDDTRIYDSASGWYKQNGASDVESIHCYFHKVPIENWKKPVIVSEFGGYSFMVKTNAAFRNNVFGYGSFENKNDLTKRIVRMYQEEIIPHIKDGISGSIYTQLSDVEEELNGLYTYDRRKCKVIKQPMRHIARLIRKQLAKLEE